MKKLYIVEMLNPETNKWFRLEFWIGTLRESLAAWDGDQYRTRRVTSRQEAEEMSKKICNSFCKWDLDTYEWEWLDTPAASD